MVWQLGLMGFAWVSAAIGLLQFHSQLQVSEIEFDGVHWYLADKVGTVSVGLDGQICMLLRFEDDLNHACWLWVEARQSITQDPDHWLSLRRAVYSPPNAQNQTQNLPNLI